MKTIIYQKTAAKTAKINALEKINNKLILDASAIPEEYRQEFISLYRRKYENGINTPSDFDFVTKLEDTYSDGHYIKTRSLYIDFTAQITICNGYRINYRIVTIQAVRIADYNALDIYYNRTPSNYYSSGNMAVITPSIYIDLDEVTAA